MVNKAVKIALVFSLVYLAPTVFFSGVAEHSTTQFYHKDYYHALAIYKDLMRSNPSEEIEERIFECLAKIDSAKIFSIDSAAYHVSGLKKNNNNASISGVITEKGSNKAMAGIPVVLLNELNKKEVSATSNKNGRFDFNVLPVGKYIVKANSGQYLVNDLAIVDADLPTSYHLHLEVGKGTESYTLIDKVMFDFDKWGIKPPGVTTLNKIQHFLKLMPNAKMELLGYTDARGTNAYNMVLAGKRAGSAKNYLVKNGVPASRLTTVARGEANLLNNCINGVKCTESQHQLNRRTEFKVIKQN